MANQKWLVQSCCDPGVTQIIISDTLLPGDVFKDLLGNCYLVLMATSGIPSPSIIIDGDTIYGSCEECGTCPSPTPSVTPSITPSPNASPTPTPSITPSQVCNAPVLNNVILTKRLVSSYTFGLFFTP
jgi:hypothetical protein